MNDLIPYIFFIPDTASNCLGISADSYPYHLYDTNAATWETYTDSPLNSPRSSHECEDQTYSLVPNAHFLETLSSGSKEDGRIWDLDSYGSIGSASINAHSHSLVPNPPRRQRTSPSYRYSPYSRPHSLPYSSMNGNHDVYAMHAAFFSIDAAGDAGMSNAAYDPHHPYTRSNILSPSHLGASMLCSWEKCGVKLDDLSHGGIRRHFKEYHRSARGTSTRCVWDPCCRSEPMLFENIPKHIAEVHIKSMKQRCDRCGGTFARKDTLKRHLNGGCPAGTQQDPIPFLGKQESHSPPSF